MSQNENVRKIKGMKKQIFMWAAMISVSILGAVYYYNLLLNIQIPVSSDDAGSTIAIYDENILGGLNKTSGNLQIFMIFSRICYVLWGYSEVAMRVVFCMNFFCMLLGSLYLIVKNEGRKTVFFDVLLLLYIVVLQGTSGSAQIQISKFHTNPTICFLVMLGFLQAYQIYKKKRYMIFAILMFFFSLVQADYLLTIVVIVAPLLIYGFFYFINSERWKKYLHYLIILIPGILLVLRIIDKLYLSYMGRSLFAFSGWGVGKVFANIEELKENSVLFIEGLLNMFNCNAGGTELISLGTAIWFVRICILAAMLIKLILVLWWLIVSFEKVDLIDGLLAISCFVTIFVYFSTPQQDVISMRYCNVLLFTIPILFLRDFGRAEMWTGDVNVFNRNVSKDIFAASGVFILVLGMVKILPIERTHMTNDDLAQAIVENDLENGIGPYWAATVSSLLTNEKSIVQAVSMQSSGMWPFMETISIYDDKCARFNFIIEDRQVTEAYDDNAFGVSRENIVSIYGEPQQQIGVGDEKTIYLYDYDVRTIPKIVSYLEGGWIYSDGAYMGEIELDESITVKLEDLEIGEYYIIVGGSNLRDTMEVLIDGQKAQFVKQENENSLKFYIKIEQFKDINEAVLKNGDQQSIGVTNIKVQKIREAVDIPFGSATITEGQQLSAFNGMVTSDEIRISAGNYKVVFYGENVDELSVEAEGNVEKFVVSERGEKRAVYILSCQEDIAVRVSVGTHSTQKVSLSNVSIEKMKE